MTDTIDKVGSEEYEPLGGFVILVGATGVEQTGLTAGALYEFVATWPCVCRWDTTDAAPTDGAFTFAVPANHPIRVRCPTGNTLLNVEEASAESHASAALFLSVVRPA